jgi:ubiquinone/menaquinone biosynthesis C-methylase UbiE/uncharacterized protein YbaR (Trm112 family)
MDCSILKCPVTKNSLLLISLSEIQELKIDQEFLQLGKIEEALIDSSRCYLYPIVQEIFILLQQYAIHIGKGKDERKDLGFDKKRVFEYYNGISHIITNSFKAYEDADKWVDYREVSSGYFHATHAKTSRFYPSTGKYFLDIASGPVSTQEYMDLSNGYNYPICIDISVNALLLAKQNFLKAGKKGIFICGDIINIPLQNNICDTVLSQHTLYHVPKNEQAIAVEELYRVTKPGGKVVIVYSWFYRSLFMNISLHFIQLYRIARHLAGKIYVRLFRSKPRLYFYAHSYTWFKTKFSFSNEIEIHSWSSINKYFQTLYIHKWFGGKVFLKWLRKMEEKHSKLMGKIGEYPVIVISKK